MTTQQKIERELILIVYDKKVDEIHKKIAEIKKELNNSLGIEKAMIVIIKDLNKKGREEIIETIKNKLSSLK